MVRLFLQRMGKHSGDYDNLFTSILLHRLPEFIMFILWKIFLRQFNYMELEFK